ncbi:hypothetical protein ACTFIW_002989 [Dictyostelium discoideum]
MSTNKKIKTDNNNKIFQDIIDFEILKSIINYILTNKKNKTNNNNNTINQYNINKFYLNRNEILNYISVSKKWYNFISLTISNNIINNKSFKHCLKINYDKNNIKSFIENYNNQNQYDKNNIHTPYLKCRYFKNSTFLKKEHKQYKTSFNKEFSIIKIKESIIDDYFKFNLFLDNITIDDFKEIKNKFENGQLLYNRIVVNGESRTIGYGNNSFLFNILEYISKENSEIISNLFKILELNFDLSLSRYDPDSEEEEEEEGHEGHEKCTELYFNNLSIFGYNKSIDNDYEEDGETVKIFKNFKGKNLIYDGSDQENFKTHVNYSPLFDPHNSGQQVESIKVKSKTYGNEEFVEPLHLVKVNQFKNLHSITIPINSLLILSNISEEMGSHGFYREFVNLGFSKNMKLELNQMINSLITSKSLKNLKISSVNFEHYPFDYKGSYYDYFKDDDDDDLVIYTNKLNETIESFSNCFQPLFSELNTSIERIKFDCMGLLNINTFSNLLNNKSIKYLYLYGESDFIVYSTIKIRGGSVVLCKEEPISIDQYLFDNIFSSPLTSIRHYKILFIESNEFKFIFNLILNNIFKLQLYSLIFEFDAFSLFGEFVKEFKNLINNISTQQQQQQQQKSNNINLKEIKIKIKIKKRDRNNYDEHIQEINNFNNPYFTTIIKRKNK